VEKRTPVRTFVVFTALALGAASSAYAQYAISGFAGGGPNGLAATASSIGYPGGVARDGGGNIYIADSYSNRVLKIDVAGVLTVFAGNAAGVGGAGGYSGDGGPATAAELARPEGVAVDGSGNVFIADSDNSVIRCVVGGAGGCFGSSLPVGNITTVAGIAYPGSTCNYSGDGGAATSAYLCQPNGVFLDAQGDLFIADTFNSVVREVMANGVIKTVAGNGIPCGAVAPCGDGGAAINAQLDLPGGVAVDGSGNVFIADTYDAVIREVAAATGNIQTVAGIYYSFLGAGDVCLYAGDGGPATSAGLCQPGGVSVDGSGNLFIADSYNHVIREVTVSDGNIATVAGTGQTSGYTGDGGAATAAELSYPNGVLVNSGDYYIADTNNYAIREVASGTIQTIAGNKTLAYSGDGAQATVASLNVPGAGFVDAAGNVFIADTYNCVIREVPAAGGNIQTVVGNGSCGYSGDGAAATAAELNYPSGLFVDGAGNIFIADTFNSAVREVVAATGFIQTVAGVGTAGYSGDGGAATAAQLANPAGVFVNAAGDVFIADTTNHVVRCVVGTAGGCFGSALAVGSIMTVAGTAATPCASAASACGDGAAATSAQLSFPGGVFGDAAGNLFVADTSDSKIREVVAATGNIQTVAGTGATGYAGDGGAATSAQLFYPGGLFVDSLGNIFIADTYNSVVREVVAVSGIIQTAAGNGTQGYAGDGEAGNVAELNHPLGVAAGPAGTVFVADSENSRVRKLTSTVSVAVIPTSATLPMGGSQQFAANVSGATDTSVTWQVNGLTGGDANVGTISALGSYTAPAAIPSGTVTVTAVANANGVATASAPVTIVDGSTTITLTLSTSPTVSEVYTGASQTFSANVTGTTNTAVNWLVNGVAGGNATVGTILAGVYTAPATVPAPALVVIGAQSQADTNVTASYPITIVTAPAASAPAPQTISAGGTAQYSMSLKANTGNPKQPITLSCLQSSLPAGAVCTFSPAKITPATAAVAFSLSISVPGAYARSAIIPRSRKNGETWGIPLLLDVRLGWGLLATFVPLSVWVLLGTGGQKRLRVLPMFAVLCGLAVMVGCGGSNGSGGGSGSNPKTYSVQVQGATAAQPNPVTLATVSLTVQ